MGEKKIKGRKRHIVTDTRGHLLHVKVHAANLHDTVSGGLVFEEALMKYPTIKGVCADAGYRKTMKNYVENVLKKLIEISERITPGWTILAKRWVVVGHFRRLSKDYEINIRSAETNVMIAHSILLLGRF